MDYVNLDQSLNDLGCSNMHVMSKDVDTHPEIVKLVEMQQRIVKRLDLITNAFFISGLLLLLLNDHVLKYALHNFWTGKISDFAGLFIFPLFFLAVYPGKRLLICLLTAALFTLIKVPEILFVREWLTSNFPFSIAADRSDLYALISIPAAYFFSKKTHSPVISSPVYIAFLSLVSFTSTSIDRERVFFDPPVYSLSEDTSNCGKGNDFMEGRECVLILDSTTSDRYCFCRITSTYLDDRYLRRDQYEVAKERVNLLARETTSRENVQVRGKFFNGTYYDLNFQDLSLQGRQLITDETTVTIAQYNRGLPHGSTYILTNDGDTLQEKIYKEGELDEVINFNAAGKSVQDIETRMEYVNKEVLALILLLILNAGALIMMFRLPENRDRSFRLAKNLTWEHVMLTILLFTSVLSVFYLSYYLRFVDRNNTVVTILSAMSVITFVSIFFRKKIKTDVFLGLLHGTGIFITGTVVVFFIVLVALMTLQSLKLGDGAFYSGFLGLQRMTYGVVFSIFGGIGTLVVIKMIHSYKKVFAYLFFMGTLFMLINIAKSIINLWP